MEGVGFVEFVCWYKFRWLIEFWVFGSGLCVVLVGGYWECDDDRFGFKCLWGREVFWNRWFWYSYECEMVRV